MMATGVAAPPEAMGGLYRAVRAIARFWLWFFFPSIDTRGLEDVPASGPVLLCINHPNNLIDSLLVAGVLPRKVHYLATAALFRNPFQARLLRAFGAIPVYRRQDDPGQMDRNVDAFVACHETLAQRGVIGIYPEGTTHAEPRVQRIRTGAARIALEYEAQRIDRQRGLGVRGEGGKGAGGPDARLDALTLLPVGIAFEARKAFGRRVRVAVGEPIAVVPYLPRYREDPIRTVNALTDAIQRSMEGQVVHVEGQDAAEIARVVDELYRDRLVRELHEDRGLSVRDIDPVRLSQSIAGAVAWFAAHDPERFTRIRGHLLAYRGLLAAYRTRDEAVRGRLDPPTVPARLRQGSLAALGLPVFAYGALVNLLPYLIPRWLARRIATRETDYATTRFLAGIIAIPLFWGLETWLIGRLVGPRWAIAFLLSLPVSGILAYQYFLGLGRLRQRLRLGILGLTRERAAARLLSSRRALITELDRARDDYLMATRGSTF